MATPGAHGAIAEVIVPCPDLDAGLAALAALGFQLERIFPADEPAIAVLSGHGVRLRLSRDAAVAPPTVRLEVPDPDAVAGGAHALTLPGGARIELVRAGAGFELPPLRPAYVVARATDAAAWRAGRAGMQYRDLLPDRQGGRFIASHIRIPDGGPVPDYAHYHEVRLQLIYCHRGWVRVVYEGQGEPFAMEPGDCVLQPPRIRHRVLACSPGLEVIELSSPALHETCADPAAALPGPAPARDHAGQRFVRHRAAEAGWAPAPEAGWQERDLGIAAGTGGLARVRVLRPAGAEARLTGEHAGELLWGCVLGGALVLDGAHRLTEADAFAIPSGRPFEVSAAGEDLECLVVTVP